MGPGLRRARDGILWAISHRRLSIPLGKHATVFHAEVHAILVCVQETETQDLPEKYVSICSDSQAALKALQASKTTSPLVRQYQQALNGSLPGILWGYFSFPGHAGVRGNEIANKLARSVSAQRFVGLEPFLGVSRQDIRRKLNRWMG